LDLDGTVYYEEHPLPGSVDFIHYLQQNRINFACLSNSTTSPLRTMDRLKNMGVEIDPTRIYTAASAAADFVLHRLKPGQRLRVFNLATEGVQEMLEGLVDWVAGDAEPCDAIIIGAPANLYAAENRQRMALKLLRKGAAAVAICADRLYPSPRGLEFGSGALAVMLAYAANAHPIYCGKPEKIFFQELCDRLKVPTEKCLLIGDNIEADIAGAKNVGMKTILTLAGVTRRRDLLRLPPAQQPDQIIENLGELL
jgi:HAD superfamily hydrolase (TIGR01450 family)